VNDAYAEVARGFGGRYGAFGSVPLPHTAAAIEEASRCLDQLGMLGIALGCSVGDRPLDDPAFDAFWAELNARKTVAFLHPIWRAGDPHAADYGLPRVVSACFEDSVAGLRLIRSGLMAKYPDVQVIVPHLGGTLPFILRRLRGIDLRRLYFDTAISHPAALRCACEVLGADRLMLGTDFPYVPPEGIPACVSMVEEAGLSPEDSAQILDGTAPALLGVSK